MTYILVFLSGFAALIYQVLWMKQLGLLFGNTSHAAGATLAAFFTGLAVGSWFWGKRSETTRNPLKVYAGLELGIAVAALLYFAVLHIFYQVYPHVYQSINAGPLLTLVKFCLALLLIFPPAFCMGGTIPVIGQYAIRQSNRFGTTSAMLYAVNTCGAALGACLAGFYLPLAVGFRNTCLGAMAVTLGVAAWAYIMSRKAGKRAPEATDKRSKNTVQNVTQPGDTPAPAHRGMPEVWALRLVCFVSGFGVLALEVLWTRMFAQVLENSVYTFAAILVIVLVCLSLGSFVSSQLAKLNHDPKFVLTVLIMLGALWVLLTPFIFMQQTDNLQIIVSRGSWADYIGLIFSKAALTLGGPALFLGIIFPYLMKVEEAHVSSAGKSLGHLAMVNTVGAILGSLLCGFVFLETLGMWGTMRAIALVYLITALSLPSVINARFMGAKAACVILLVLQFNILNPTRLPINSMDKDRPDESILRTWEGSDCTVAVAESPQGRSIKINSHYGLGSTGAYLPQKMQSDIPLMAHQHTTSVFFLGMGTGITAGSALNPMYPDIKRVVTCELVPEVIEAAKEYMTDINGYDPTNGLFTDPRSTVLAEDGRHYLMATNESFDLINSDLFVPFRSGAGSLYSREHFESVKERLSKGGLFFQWLPLYQVTEKEFYIITRTMLEVFDQVSMWRNNFQPSSEVIALVGHKDNQPYPASAYDDGRDRYAAVYGKTHRDLQNLQLPLNPQTIFYFYCGNITQSKDLFMDTPVNTDDKPLIEYTSPMNYRNLGKDSLPWFVGPRIIRLIDTVQENCPPDRDPLLANRSAVNRRLPLAGSAFHWARLWEIIGDERKTHEYWQTYLENWLPELAASPGNTQPEE